MDAQRRGGTAAGEAGEAGEAGDMMYGFLVVLGHAQYCAFSGQASSSSKAVDSSLIASVLAQSQQNNQQATQLYEPSGPAGRVLRLSRRAAANGLVEAGEPQLRLLTEPRDMAATVRSGTAARLGIQQTLQEQQRRPELMSKSTASGQVGNVGVPPVRAEASKNVTWDKVSHSLSLQLQRDVAAVLGFAADYSQDLFQFGRASSAGFLDCSEDDLEKDLTARHLDTKKSTTVHLEKNSTVVGSETDSCALGSEEFPNDASLGGVVLRHGPLMSRFAFRIQVEREAPYTARLFAGGFDRERHFFLGDAALCWTHPRYDGFVTNGVRMLCLAREPVEPEDAAVGSCLGAGDPPRGSIDQVVNETGVHSAASSVALMARRTASAWREVSCRGSLHMLRPHHRSCGRLDVDAENVLGDVTIISAGGLNLLWVSARRAREVRESVTLKAIDLALNGLRPVCPVTFATITFNFGKELERTFMTRSGSTASEPWVFPACGHVHGALPDDPRARDMCPLCRRRGPFVPLLAPADYALSLCSVRIPLSDIASRNYALEHGHLDVSEICVFNPCGHVVSTRRVAEFWAHLVRVPALHESVYDEPHHCFCPFCRCPLGKPAYSLVRVESLDALEDGSLAVTLASAPVRLPSQEDALTPRTQVDQRSGTFYGELKA